MDPQNTREKKFGRTKYPRDKILDARNTREKKFGRTKYPRDEILDLRNTHETKFRTYEIPTRQNFGPTEYPRDKILDLQNSSNILKLRNSLMAGNIQNTHFNDIFGFLEMSRELDFLSAFYLICGSTLADVYFMFISFNLKFS